MTVLVCMSSLLVIIIIIIIIIILRVLLMGDFNVPAIDWQELTYSGSSNDFTAEFLCTVQNSYLSQHVTGFTHYRQGQRPSLLDLVFTYNPDTFDHVKHCSPLGSSDHECLMWQYKVSIKELDYKYAACRYNFWKGNYPSICEKFDKIDWDSLLQNDSLDTNWKLFKHRVLAVANKFIPKINRKPVTNKPPYAWWSTHINRAVKENNKFNQYKCTLLPTDYANYALKCNQVKALIRSAQAQFNQSLMTKLRLNPKVLYSYVRDKSKIRSTISQLEKPDSTLTTCREESAEILNRFFESVAIY